MVRVEVTRSILEQKLQGVVKLSKMGLGKAEQLCKLSAHMYSCLFSNSHLPGASLALVEVLLTLLKNL